MFGLIFFSPVFPLRGFGVAVLNRNSIREATVQGVLLIHGFELVPQNCSWVRSEATGMNWK